MIQIPASYPQMDPLQILPKHSVSRLPKWCNCEAQNQTYYKNCSCVKMKINKARNCITVPLKQADRSGYSSQFWSYHYKLLSLQTQLRTCNASCFTTATMVMRTRLNVTFRLYYTSFLRAWAKLRKATIIFFMSICLSSWNNSAPIGRIQRIKLVN